MFSTFVLLYRKFSLILIWLDFPVHKHTRPKVPVNTENQIYRGQFHGMTVENIACYIILYGANVGAAGNKTSTSVLDKTTTATRTCDYPH